LVISSHDDHTRPFLKKNSKNAEGELKPYVAALDKDLKAARKPVWKDDVRVINYP
jgi:hypothetical protein